MKMDFFELKNKYFTVSDIFVTKQRSITKTSIDMCATPRDTDAFCFFESGTAICYQEGYEPCYVSQGTLMYMPKGSLYTWDVLPAATTGENERILFEFTLNESLVKRSNTIKRAISTAECGETIHFSDHVVTVSDNHSSGYKILFEKLLDKFTKVDQNPLEIYSTIYEIFSFIANDYSNDKRKSDFKIIEKSINYLENDCEFKLNMRDLADMDNVSLRYFEKLFKEYSGVSPKEYMDSRRISYIKILLCENNMTLDEIAQRLSFYDSGHLCRFFKQKTGLTPTEYKKLYL
ncbi:MAG: helix-turn-helix domain-containing protein [Ruminococcaceae bacterium]|nr:helix-turn-helix domain-containing protein [Oscillospiraceae bacterium]